MNQINLFEILFEPYKITKHIRLIELFAGIGSQAKALERLNVDFQHYKVVEFDKYAIKSYNAIHDTNFETSDITLIHAKDLEIVETDKYEYIMAYSFPCQDLSLAGKQRGMKKGSGTRSGLLWEVERLLDECVETNGNLPQVLLMENVPEVIGSKNIEHFQEWERKLESFGYRNYCQVLNAKNYGIPQNRKRCFMISILGDYYYEFPKPFKLKLKLKDMLEDVADEKYYLSQKMIESFNHHAERHRNRGNGFGWKPTQGEGIANALTASANCRSSDNFIKVLGTVNIGNNESNNRIYAVDGISPTLNTCQGGNRQVKVLIPEKTKRGYKEAYEGDGVYINRPHQKRGTVQNGMIQTLKTSGNDVGVVVSEPKIIDDAQGFDGVREYESYSLTLRATRSGLKVEHNLRIRKLTPLECWCLMGFDDEDFYKAEKVNSNTQLYKQAGNSIVVNVLEEILKKLF